MFQPDPAHPSGREGELFDHGLDSMAVWLMPWTLMHVVGLEDGTSVSHNEWYWVSWAFLISFYVPHLEKYMTGVIPGLARVWLVHAT